MGEQGAADRWTAFRGGPRRHAACGALRRSRARRALSRGGPRSPRPIHTDNVRRCTRGLPLLLCHALSNMSRVDRPRSFMTLSAISSYASSTLLRCALVTPFGYIFLSSYTPRGRSCTVSFYSVSFYSLYSHAPRLCAIRRLEASWPGASIACCRRSISSLACDRSPAVYRLYLHPIAGIPCAPSRCGYPKWARFLEASSASPQGTCSRCLDGDHPTPSCAADR